MRKGGALRHDGAFRERKFPCEDGKQKVRKQTKITTETNTKIKKYEKKKVSVFLCSVGEAGR